jgi:GPH family glycoside/pentoside/hexuronide:cation symporter
MTTPTTARTDVLPVSLKAGWGVGAFGIALLLNGISTLIFFYMVGILKLEPALAGAIIFAAKIVDVIVDLAVGIWSDRLQSSRGRRRPFLLWGGMICAASFAMIFTTPLFANTWLTTVYAFTALCLYSIGYTAYNIPYLAMPAEMTDSYHERSSIHAWRMAFVTVGSFVAGSIAPAVLERLGRTVWTSYALIGIVCAALILISTWAAYAFTAKARFTMASTRPVTLFADYLAISKNRHFMRLIGVKFAQLLGGQATQAAMLFFIVQSLQLRLTVLVVFGLAVTLSSLLATPLLVKFSRRYGKKAGYYVAAFMTALYALSWSFAGPGEPLWAIALRGLIIGVGFTGNVLMAMSMLTDIINFDARQSGAHRESAYTALYSFVEKFTAALGPLIIGFALSLAHFNTKLPPDVPQPGDVRFALLFSVSWLPALAGLVAVWLLSGYKLTQADLENEPR